MTITPTDYLPYDFANRRHIGPSPAEMAEMFKVLGVKDLDELIGNLLENAAKYGGGSVFVTIGRDGAMAEILVEDDGPGIPEAVLGQVFEPFFRADPARRQNIPGAGLGLTIAHEIVTRAGGSIQIVNRPAGGLLQTVSLPEVHEPDEPDTDSA